MYHHKYTCTQVHVHPSTHAPKYTCTQVHAHPSTRTKNIRHSKNEIVFLMLYLYAGGYVQNTKY